MTNLQKGKELTYNSFGNRKIHKTQLSNWTILDIEMPV